MSEFFSTIGMLPACQFCPEGQKKYAVYEFKLRNNNWAFGCNAHYVEHRLFNMLGNDRGRVLCIPRPGTMIGAKLSLLPISRRAVYKPAFVFIVEEDSRGWKGLSLNDRGEPTNATVFEYPRSNWRTHK